MADFPPPTCAHAIGCGRSILRKHNNYWVNDRDLQFLTRIGGRLRRSLQKFPPHEQQCRNYMQTRQLLPTTLTKLTFWLTFLLSNAPQQQPTKIYQVLLFLYPQTKLCTTKSNQINTFSHHPAPAQCTPSHPCNLLSSHVKHTILYSFV